VGLPELYLEGLTQRALRGREPLNVYKLGLIEAILKEALADDDPDCPTVRLAVKTALSVARWEMPAPRRRGPNADSGPG
jgi:hypothetical protein